MKPIENITNWFKQPFEEKVLDVVTTFIVGGVILGLLSVYVWTSVLLPIGIIAGVMLVVIVIADEIFVGRVAAASYRASQRDNDND